MSQYDHLRDKLTPEQIKEQSEARLRLEEEVSAHKKLINEGKAKELKQLHEIRMESHCIENIVCIGDVMAPALEKLTQLAEEEAKFWEWLNKKIEKLKPIFCKHHPEIQLQIHRERTAYETKGDGGFTPIYSMCEKCKNPPSLVNEKWKKMGIPSNLLECTLDNFETKEKDQEKAITRVRKQLEQKGGFLILRGKVGTGKSHLAVGVIKHLGDGIIVTEADLIAELRETYSTNSGQDTMVSKYRKPKVLVLDELTTEVKGVDIPTLLYRILGHRYSENLLTVITSNETLETIMSILGPRLTDRIRESHQIVTLEGESYRVRK